jgi:hypothetical protein
VDHEQPASGRGSGVKQAASEHKQNELLSSATTGGSGGFTGGVGDASDVNAVSIDDDG